MAPFDYQPLGRVVFAPGALSRAGDLARELGGSRVLLVTDPGLEAAGHPQRTVQSLREAKLEVSLFDGVEENPTERHVEAALVVGKKHRADFLVAVGGGSAMDVAKGANFLLTNGGRMTDYRGYGKATKPMLPSIGIPTTAGTGSEAQSYALIADDSTHLKMACGDRKVAFRIAILDPELTVTQPATVTAITGIDSIAHAVESFVSTKRTPFSQMLGRQAWTLLNENIERVLHEPTNLAARSAMQLGAHLAGMAIENSMLGCAHSCANPLTAHYGITHGVAVGVMLPSVIRFNAEHVRSHYADLHSGGAETLAERLRRLLQSAKLATNLGDLGVSRSILPVLAEEAAQQWTAQFNPRPASVSDLARMYEAAF